MEKEVEIKSSLINDPDFKFVKESLLEAAEKDGEVTFRVKTLEYINDSSAEQDDQFFYDMLEFVRFLTPGGDDIAYTTPEHLIYLNCPDSHIGKNIKQWEFTYDHECLHQLWDTFGVADRIKKEYGSYDHELLNIASDCVINDYLYYYRKKDRPEDLITPEWIEKNFNVKYDRRNDTQFSLYLKIKEFKDKNKKEWQKLWDSLPDELKKQLEGESQSQGNNGSGSSSNGKEKGNEKGSGSGSGSGSGDKEKGNEKGSGSGSGDKEKGNEKGNGNGGSDSGDKEQEHDNDNGKSNDLGHGDDNEESDDNKGNSNGNGKGGHAGETITKADLENIKKKAEKIIEKWRDKLSGDIGEFIGKCKNSVQLNPNGLAVGNVKNGTTGWNKQMNTYVHSFVKNKVFQKKKEFKRTYSRINRRSGFINFGDPIKPGKKVKDELLTINTAFYVDRSGSMYGNPIDNVFKAVYTIAESLKKDYSKEKVVGDIAFKLFAFDTRMHLLNWGDKISAAGGNMDGSEIFDYIEKNTNDFLINIIITDAQFSFAESTIKELLKKTNGMVLFITNNECTSIKKIAKDSAHLFYILADNDFTIK